MRKHLQTHYKKSVLSLKSMTKSIFKRLTCSNRRSLRARARLSRRMLIIRGCRSRSNVWRRRLQWTKHRSASSKPGISSHKFRRPQLKMSHHVTPPAEIVSYTNSLGVLLNWLHRMGAWLVARAVHRSSQCSHHLRWHLVYCRRFLSQLVLLKCRNLANVESPCKSKQLEKRQKVKLLNYQSRKAVGSR